VLHSDLPHEYFYVAKQLAKSPVNNEYQMSGFVETYAKVTQQDPAPKCEPMGFFNSCRVPVTDFLAKNFCVCDKWHASLPTGTIPNRNMAFCGESTVHETERRLILIKNTLFKWLNRHDVRWRVYYDGLSFFVLYKKLWKYVLGKNFRRYEHFASDMLNEPPADTPQVIIVEPNYKDMPPIGSKRPNYNHPPLSVGWGRRFFGQDIWSNNGQQREVW
jgi:phospholipase C